MNEKLNLKVKDWYVNAYSTDDLGEEIKPDVTFADIDQNLESGAGIYDVFGVDDSLVRERIFEKLSELLGVDYNVIYDRWLGN